jgi:hypothetical protein
MRNGIKDWFFSMSDYLEFYWYIGVLRLLGSVLQTVTGFLSPSLCVLEGYTKRSELVSC